MTNGYPKVCPLCAESIGHGRLDDEIVMPSISRARSAVGDKLYREMERTSEVRAETAAAMAGVSASDMSGLRMTNMSDSTRQGDIAALPVVNDVTRAMDRLPMSGWQGPQGIAFSGAVQEGHFANTGARFQSLVRQEHARANGWGRVGDLPANEVSQPGYRRRV